VVLASLALVACSGESGNPLADEWRATVDTIGDTITVRTLSGSVWGDTATLVPEVTIGTLDGADEYLIGDPVAIAVGADGVIYMLDRTRRIQRAQRPGCTSRRKDPGPRSWERARRCVRSGRRIPHRMASQEQVRDEAALLHRHRRQQLSD
jgi:hypothetical protein